MIYLSKTFKIVGAILKIELEKTLFGSNRITRVFSKYIYIYIYFKKKNTTVQLMNPQKTIIIKK